MKRIVYLILLICLSTSAQDKYLTRTGVVSFEASVPTFEQVEASTNAVTAILNTKNGEFAALVFIKGFRFKNALMEEHFNENYAESYKYPKATFKGKLQNFSFNTLSDTINSIGLDGVLSFHGKENTLQTILVNITKKNAAIIISGEFFANASDYNIKIPKIVRNKISKDIKVSFEFILQKKPSN
ncbi:MAG: YceI family protein [Flavobacteriaceae bacterium]|nr:YceI family protein [Flavobacteriaceae bacterium]